MIDVIREREEDRLHEVARREADAEAGHVDGTNLVRCTWEEQHPGETCPICTEGMNGATARDSVGHIDEVVELLDVRSAMDVADALGGVGIVVALDYIRHLSEDDRAAVKAWAEFDRDSSEQMPPRPAVLGTGHVAGAGVNDEAQCCTQCDAILIEGGLDANYYNAGSLVGVDCPGRAKADGQHYPEKRKGGRKKKPAAE